MFLGDFHVHSNFSDGKHSIPEVVDLFGSRGFGVIAFTDHICERRSFLGKAAGYLGQTLTPATFPLYCEILKSEAERAWRMYRMVVLTGYEFSKNSVSNSRSAHMLGIFGEQQPDFLWADGDVSSLCARIRSQGGIAVAAHPVSTRKMEKQTYYLWDRREELANDFDAWEVASGPYLFDEVLRARVPRRLPMIASSDLHVARQITSWKTVLNCERHPEAILDAIRKQEVEFKFYQEAHTDGSSAHSLVASMGAGSGSYAVRDLLLRKAL